jgi:hypothetical protein
MQFLANKYTKWYYKIISSVKNLGDRRGYLEVHHVIPTVCGGVGGEDNVVRLTAREHYICHMLLIKMTTGREQEELVAYLNNFNCKTSKQYQALKILDTFKELSTKQDLSKYSKSQWAKLNRALVTRTKEISI